MKIIYLVLFLLFSPFSYATMTRGVFDPGSTFAVCFTPFHPCNEFILDLLNNAQRSIKVQAYGMSNCAIIRALVDAKKRGVEVTILLDKGALLSKYNFILFDLHKSGIPFLIDYQTGIAHNKLIIVDDEYVETGSFNYYQDIEKINAENLLIIKSKNLVPYYVANFDKLKNLSKPYIIPESLLSQPHATCLRE